MDPNVFGTTSSTLRSTAVTSYSSGTLKRESGAGAGAGASNVGWRNLLWWRVARAAEKAKEKEQGASGSAALARENPTLHDRLLWHSLS